MTEIFDTLKLQSAQVLSLKPNDVIVLKFGRRLQGPERTMLNSLWRELWGENQPKCIILDEGADIHVLRQEIKFVDIEVSDGQAPGNSY